MLTGNCLCGDVVYKLNCDIQTIVFCHCSRCRKQTGSAFNSATVIDKSNLIFIKGQEKISVYSHLGVNRHFCSTCGSPLFSSRDNDEKTYRLRLGAINEQITSEKHIHIYTASKANWDVICDGFPQYDEAMPSS